MKTILEEFKKSLKNIEMTKQEGNFSLLHYVGFLGGCFFPYLRKYYDFDFGSMFFFSENKQGLLFFDVSKYILTTQKTFKRFLKSKGISKEINDFNLIRESIEEMYVKYTPNKISSLKEFDLLIKKLFSLYHRLVASTVFSESLNEGQIKKYYKEINGNDVGFNDFFLIVSIPTFESFALRMDRALISKKKSITGLQYLFSDYYITPQPHLVDEKIKELIIRRGGLVKIRKEIKDTENELSRNRKIVSKYKMKLSGDKKLLCSFVQMSMYVRDIRKESLQKLLTIISNVTRAIFTNNGLNPEDAAYAMYEDFEKDFHHSNYYLEEINKRKKGFVAMMNAKEIRFEYGNISKKKKQFFRLIDEGTKGSFEIIGNIAYPGVVRGEVQIVISKKDFSKFKKGNILVTSMTRPEFIPIMKKAIAVITDEGGITCHAAIVSRELKIPCIIGTKKATRILHDGDTVDLDAIKGIVKIVK